MNVTHYNKSFPYIIIDNFYEDWELSLIWDELKFINHSYKWQTPTDNPGDGAKNIKTGEQLRKNKFQWIDSFYSNRHYSNILNVNRKIFNQDVWDECFKKHPHWFFNGFDCRHDTTLLSYYDEDGDEYKPHRDSSYVTCLFWTFIEYFMKLVQYKFMKTLEIMMVDIVYLNFSFIPQQTKMPL